MIIAQCRYCDKDMEHPKIGRVYCSDKCRKAGQRLSAKYWARRNNAALSILKANHLNEFMEIREHLK